MPNILEQIDKKYGTEFSTKIQGGSFMNFVNYIEQQYMDNLAPFEPIMTQFEQITNGKNEVIINKHLVVKYLRDETMDRISQVVEYAVDFFTRLYKLDDFDEIKDKLINLATRLNTLAMYRHDHYEKLVVFLKIK